MILAAIFALLVLIQGGLIIIFILDMACVLHHFSLLSVNKLRGLFNTARSLQILSLLSHLNCRHIVLVLSHFCLDLRILGSIVRSYFSNNLLLFLSNLTQKDLHLIVTHELSLFSRAFLFSFFNGFRGWSRKNFSFISSFWRKYLTLIPLSLICDVFELVVTHGGPFWIFVQDKFVGFLPHAQYVLQVIISLNFGSFDQIPNLKALLAQLNYPLIVFCQYFALS